MINVVLTRGLTICRQTAPTDLFLSVALLHPNDHRRHYCHALTAAAAAAAAGFANLLQHVSATSARN